MLALIFLSLIGAAVNYLVLDRVQQRVSQESMQAAAVWMQTLQPGDPRQPVPRTRIDLLQLVDSRGRVVTASAAAAGRPALSTIMPQVDHPEQDRVECSAPGKCIMVTALRVPSLMAAQLWRGEPHFIYAGMVEPPILATKTLEISTAAAIVLLTGLVAGGNWWLAGRTLRPVAAIRERMSEITVRDLSLRVPTPPGRTEYTLLIGTINQTLARLEETVREQRRFAATTSHELRTPIAGLRTNLEEALLYPDDVDPRSAIRAALSTTERLELIVDDLLVLARLRAGEPAVRERIDLGALVREEAATRSGQVRMHVRAAPDVRVLGSRIQLIRVLDNLLANARRHADHEVEVTAERAGGLAVVTVTDDGDGIAAADRERVFERFVRLEDGRRREQGGSGLGLTISRDIAHAHNGTLRIEDSPRGARFVLRLPAVYDVQQAPDGTRPPPAAHQKAPPPPPAGHGVQARVGSRPPADHK
ncbi:sensor histidine kinase [Nonomuraea jiangxiensis]|uniref:sensor histidine kinase n=1 Tax=Nonomuraea jiangxiensis TaxID=633440 RepID=UPI00115FFEC9|nr:ATP-binding protein [Nonomuraea jiangxiensis]